MSNLSASIAAPLRLGLIGAGIFMRDAHLPSLARLSHLYQVVAMCSKSGESARKLAETLPETLRGSQAGSIAIYTSPAELLARADIDVVDVVLPIDSMADVIAQALRAGKHLISEKPITGDSAMARQLLDLFRQNASHFLNRQWMVAENWRYEAAFSLTKDLIDSGEIGKPLTFHWAQHVAMNPANKYFHTAWRREGHLAGGFLLDVGVHHASALRMIFGEVESVTADREQFSPFLPPVDTLAATIRLKNGMVGSYLLSFAAGAGWQPLLHIIGESGSMRIQRGFVEVSSQGQVRTLPCAGMNGVEVELAAFANAILGNEPHRNSPQAALQDLLVVEAMLKAAQTGQRQQVEVL